MSSASKSPLPEERDKGIVQQPVSQFGDAYAVLLKSLEERIHESRMYATLAVNRELTTLYWDIGRQILDEQQKQGWGAQVVEQLSQDLGRAFPEVTSFSVRNLRSMRAFAEAYADSETVKQLVSQIPWGHTIILIEKIKDPQQCVQYPTQTTVHGWPRGLFFPHITPC
jgi:predicted nuclease of restriction endonuclease-like (RecB) superfamily